MRKGQVSLEFMFVFAIFLVLLVYSVNNVTFTQNSASVDTLRVQVSIEAKHMANAISNTISQVYAQGPGSKATTYLHLRYLNDQSTLQKAYGTNSSMVVFLSYLNGTYVDIINPSNPTLNLNETNTTRRNVFWSEALYKKDITTNSTVFPDSITVNGTTLYGLSLSPGSLPSMITIVVEWNPSAPENWTFQNATIRINIKPGG
ncbi:class III signal peptide-containing protein [Palaeococcus ferrophilus]|uniref:class III signal peptide-containing protein n=1 Tax=Palaeococcus ferrophilus TaxID=83868 RepID=UPI000A00059A|nr:class III signal peptide-containing protein [Palaeococcus ferrophilus]